MAELKLVIISPGQNAVEMLVTTSASIGRSSDNAIRLEDPGVARYHAVIENRAGGFWLSDLGSANGTLLNGAPVTGDSMLQAGDTISLGQASQISIAASGKLAETAPQQSAASPELPSDTAGQPSGISTSHLLAAAAVMIVVFGAVAASLILFKSTKSSQPAQSAGAIQQGVAATPPPEMSATPAVAMSAAVATTSGDATEQMVRLLLTSISGKSSYVLDPLFTSRIGATTQEFRLDVSQEATAYRLEIERAFSNSKGMKPLLGYVLAMSQSRFGRTSGSGVGVWQVPGTIAKDYLQPGEDLSALNTPRRSAEVAASYLNEILTKFESQDFMYAIACYGLPASRVGEMRQQLQAVDPAERRDFWKMVERGIVPPDGAERVIRFFAAGIVGENPSAFGLSARPFSELS